MYLTIILSCICCLSFTDEVYKEKLDPKSESYKLEANHVEFQKLHNPLDKNSFYLELSGPFPQLRFGLIIEDKENCKFYKYGFMTMGILNGIEGSVNWVKGKSFYTGLNMHCSKWNDVFGRKGTLPGLSIGFQMGSNITNNSYWTLKPINVPIPVLIGKVFNLCKGKRSWDVEPFMFGDLCNSLVNTSVCIGYKF